MFFKKYLLIIITIITPLHLLSAEHIFPALPLEIRQKQINEVESQFQQRWQKVKSIKNSFIPYQKKSDEDLIKEFQQLSDFRQNLWYRNPKNSPHITQEEYMIDQRLLEKGYYRTINNTAFAYNSLDGTYNGSRILIDNHYFIAMMEPLESTRQLFFKLLINHGASILVRVKPENEYINQGSIHYWENKLTQNKDILFINLDPSVSNWSVKPVPIPYFFTNDWVDDKAMNVQALNQLVQKVRHTYQQSESKGPIAVHCAGGVGRTGTFIAAYILADMLDHLKQQQISIEELVLKLSIQRPNMVGAEEQYVLLHRFVEYYLEQKTKFVKKSQL